MVGNHHSCIFFKIFFWNWPKKICHCPLFQCNIVFTYFPIMIQCGSYSSYQVCPFQLYTQWPVKWLPAKSTDTLKTRLKPRVHLFLVSTYPLNEETQWCFRSPGVNIYPELVSNGTLCGDYFLSVKLLKIMTQMSLGKN